MQEPFRTSEWWDNRVRERKAHLKDLIFNDDYRDQFWDRVDEFLSNYSKYSVADIGCGYGRFAKHFKDYTGYDFSPEMIKLANKQNPDKRFYRKACCEPINEKVDIVFEVNCLHSFGKSREEFVNFYKDYANVAIVCIERNGITLEWLYPKKDYEKNRVIS
jgi:SAM-dependent methyltransferase